MRIGAGLAVLRHRYAYPPIASSPAYGSRGSPASAIGAPEKREHLGRQRLPLRGLPTERNGRFAEHADEPATVFVEVSEALLARCPLRSARTPGRQRQLSALAPCGIPGAQSAGWSWATAGRGGGTVPDDEPSNAGWQAGSARPVNVESRAARGRALWITRIVDQIPLRADCSLAGEGLMAWCEAQLGRLLVRARPPRSPDRRHHRRADRSCKAQPARRFADFTGPCWAA